MQKVKLDTKESHIGIIIEKTVSEKKETGIWIIKIYFSINNSTDRNIRVININANKYDIGLSRESSALTIGSRPGVDLTIKDSLLESGYYYDIEPTRQQTLIGTLNVSRWERIPVNKTDGDSSVFFNIVVDYYGIYKDKLCLLRVTVPFIFYFNFAKEFTPIEGKLLCIDENNVHSLPITKPDDQNNLIEWIKNQLNEIKNSAYILSESEKNFEEDGIKDDKIQRKNNLDYIKKIRASTNGINILHISDIHFGTTDESEYYGAQLNSDLLYRLKICKLNYLVISGDIANTSIQAEYDAALLLIDIIKKQFDLNNNRIIIVPGNHDLNWSISKKGYASNCVNTTILKKRFGSFIDDFYNKIRGENDRYPYDYEDQYKIYKFEDDKILFLALNSSWEIDHQENNRKKASINMVALSRAINIINLYREDKTYLKIAVFHHPVMGIDMMNNEFMQQLAILGFKICMHGHIHRSESNNYFYDYQRNINIIGAGTFGAIASEQIAGIPLQYNLLRFNPEARTITVETRKKEDKYGAWSPDARWPNKNHSEWPLPWYNIVL